MRVEKNVKEGIGGGNCDEALDLRIRIKFILEGDFFFFFFCFVWLAAWIVPKEKSAIGIVMIF